MCYLGELGKKEEKKELGYIRIRIRLILLLKCSMLRI